MQVKQLIGHYGNNKASIAQARGICMPFGRLAHGGTPIGRDAHENVE